MMRSLTSWGAKAMATGYIVNLTTGENLGKHLESLKSSLRRYLEMSEPDSGWDTRSYGGEPFEEKIARDIERVEKRIAELAA